MEKLKRFNTYIGIYNCDKKDINEMTEEEIAKIEFKKPYTIKIWLKEDFNLAYMTSKGLDIMRNTVIERKKAQEEYGNKIKFLKVKDGEKKRIRFLVDINEVLNII